MGMMIGTVMQTLRRGLPRKWKSVLGRNRRDKDLMDGRKLGALELEELHAQSFENLVRPIYTKGSELFPTRNVREARRDLMLTSYRVIHAIGGSHDISWA